MHVAAETIWLDLLEALPPCTTVIFTTNHAGKLSQRFLARRMRLFFESDAGKLARSARQLLAAIRKQETGKVVDLSSFSHLVDAATIDGQPSFRRAVGLLEVELIRKVQP